MPLFSIVIAGLLVVLGLMGYLPERESVTALIPAFAGVLIGVAATVALLPGARKHGMHAVAALALLGTLATLRGLFQWFGMMAGAEVERPAAVWSQAGMAVLCGVLLAACVMSFISARKRRQAEMAAGTADSPATTDAPSQS